MRKVIGVVAGCLSLFGCNESASSSDLCAEGDRLESSSGAVACVYSAIVIESGSCPSEVPFEFDLGATRLCSSEEWHAVGDIPEDICREISECVTALDTVDGGPDGTDGGFSEPAIPVDLSVGDANCALMSDGTVQCWAGNFYGTVGDGTVMDFKTSPVRVSGLTDAVAITSGSAHTCAIRAGGQAVCWGDNANGKLGNGVDLIEDPYTTSPTPVAVMGLADAVAISAGVEHTCAIREGGQAVCWGWRGPNGLLGDGHTDADYWEASSIPVEVPGLNDAIAIAAGGVETCAIREGGQVVCWGLASEVGDGSPVYDPDDPSTHTVRLSPVNVVGLSDAIALEGTCAIRAGGQMVCWGPNSYNKLGNGTPWDHNLVMGDVIGMTDTVDLAPGGQFGCAVHEGGQVSCWGFRMAGALGDGQFWAAPVGMGNYETTCTDGTSVSEMYSLAPVNALVDNAVKVESGENHACALTATHEVKCWGINTEGQLGDGTEIDHSVPVTVTFAP